MTWLAVAGMLLQGLTGHPPRHITPLGDYVELSLSADQESYYVGEGMRLTITARNTSDTTVSARLELHPVLGLARVLYRRPGGTDFAHLPDLRWDESCGSLGRHTLEPGEEHSVTTMLSVTAVSRDPTYYLFDEPGQYDFMVRYADTFQDPNGLLESNVLAVNVIEPPAHESGAFADYTPDLAYAAQFYSGRSFLSPEVTRAAADFIERFANSRYAPPVREGLRKSLLYRTSVGVATQEEQDLYEVLFSDTAAPILDVSASPSTLWPPNHKLVSVTLDVAAKDEKDPDPEILLESITCDDGCDPALDIADALLGVDDREFSLRAERTGSGAGRTYTITYSGTDRANNKTTAAATVVVPHDQGKKKGKKR